MQFSKKLLNYYLPLRKINITPPKRSVTLKFRPPPAAGNSICSLSLGHTMEAPSTWARRERYILRALRPAVHSRSRRPKEYPVALLRTDDRLAAVRELISPRPEVNRRGRSFDIKKTLSGGKWNFSYFKKKKKKKRKNQSRGNLGRKT